MGKLSGPQHVGSLDDSDDMDAYSTNEWMSEEATALAWAVLDKERTEEREREALRQVEEMRRAVVEREAELVILRRKGGLEGGPPEATMALVDVLNERRCQIRDLMGEVKRLKHEMERQQKVIHAQQKIQDDLVCRNRQLEAQEHNGSHGPGMEDTSLDEPKSLRADFGGPSALQRLSMELSKVVDPLGPEDERFGPLEGLHVPHVRSTGDQRAQEQSGGAASPVGATLARVRGDVSAPQALVGHTSQSFAEASASSFSPHGSRCAGGDMQRRPKAISDQIAWAVTRSVREVCKVKNGLIQELREKNAKLMTELSRFRHEAAGRRVKPSKLVLGTPLFTEERDANFKSLLAPKLEQKAEVSSPRAENERGNLILIKSLERKLAASEELADKAVRELATLRAEYAIRTVETPAHSVEEECDIAKLKEEVVALKQKNADLKIQHSVVQEANKMYLQNEQQAAKELGDLHSQIDALRDGSFVKAMQDESEAELRAKIAFLQQGKDAVQSNYTKLERQHSVLKGEVQELRALVEKERKLNKNTVLIRQLEGKVASLMNDLDCAKGDPLLLLMDYNQIRKEATQENALYSRVRQEERDRTQRNPSFAKTIENLEAQIAILQREVFKESQRADHFERDKLAAERELRALRWNKGHPTAQDEVPEAPAATVDA